MELDESIDAFKKPSSYANSTTKKQQKTLKTRDKATVKKTKSSANSTLNSATIKSGNAYAGGTHGSEENIRDAGGTHASEENIPDYKIRPGKPMQVYTQQKRESALLKGLDEDCDFVKPCQTCGKVFRLAELRIHVPICLRLNFEACRVASRGSRSTPELSKPKPTDSAGSSLCTQAGTLHKEPYFCPTCGTDISSLNKEQRNLHANRCLDNPNDPPPKVNAPEKAWKLSKKKKANSTECHRCLMCTKVQKSHSGLKRHYVACQKKHKISTMAALALHRPENGEEVDIELLAEIKKSEEREIEAKAGVGRPVKPKKKTMRKPRKKKGPKDYEEEMVELAKAASKGDDLSKSKPKKKEVIKPVMLTLSPKSKEKQLQDRMQRILDQAQTEKDEEVPSTPGLPVSSLDFTSIRRNVRLISNVLNDSPKNDELCFSDGPSTSGIRSVNNSQQSQFLAVNSEEGTPSEPVRNVENAEPFESSIQGSATSSLPKLTHENELQSPEVSSSNIKNSCLSDASDSPGASCHDFLQRQEREVQCDATVHSEASTVNRWQRPSKWTMTAVIGNNSDCRVRGLLSQFEPKNPSASTSSVPSTQTLQDSYVEPCEKQPIFEPLPEEKTTLQNDFETTLMALERLENEFQENSQGSVKPNSPDQGSLTNQSRNLADEGGATNVASNLGQEGDTSFSRAFESLIDNPLYSDAKILLGPQLDIFHVHKMILHCRCPSLLQELNESRDNCLRLREFSKKDLFPIMQHIYSNKIDVALQEAQLTRENLGKILSLAHRFRIPIPTDMSHPPDASGIFNEEASDLESRLVVEKSQQHSQLDDSDHEFLSQPSPTQKSELFAASPSPPATHDEEIVSDCDMFELQNVPSAPVFERSQKISSSFPEMTYESNQLPHPLSLHKVKPDESESVPNMSLNYEAKFHHKTISDVSSYDFADDSSHLSSSQDDSMIHSEPDLKLGGPNKKPPKVKRGKVNPGKSQRQSVTCSMSKHILRRPVSGRIRGKKSCFCCQEPNRVYVNDKLPRLEQREHVRSHLVSSSQKTRKSSWKLSPFLRKSPNVSSKGSSAKLDANDIPVLERDKQTEGRERKPQKRDAKATQKVGRMRPDAPSCSSVADSLSDSILNTPVSKRRKQSSTTPKVQKKEVIGRKSIARRKDRRKKSLGIFHAKRTSASTPDIAADNKKRGQRRKTPIKKQVDRKNLETSPRTVYVDDQLPSFEEREHIKSRPGVANMGKTGNKNAKFSKKDTSELKLKELKEKRLNEVNVSIELLPATLPIPNTSISESETANKKCKFKRIKARHLRTYASSTPFDGKKISPVHDSDSSCSEISGYGSDGDLFFNVGCDDSFEEDCSKENRVLSGDVLKSCELEKPDTPVQTKNTVLPTECFGPVPITPMPNFNEMETPEVKKQAQKFGLKKTLGKAKMKTKLKEVYMYKHQIVSDVEDLALDDYLVGNGAIETASDIKKEHSQDILGEESSDDLTGEMRRWKLELSPLSAMPPQRSNSNSVYSFGCLTPAEVTDLSSKVVEQMHMDKTLVQALNLAKKETGSIKRGSRRDQERCWDIVTPGSSGYDPKINAILSLPEEYQSAITGPLVTCVVKNYIDYKKYMFDCLPVICDRMEQEKG